MLAELAFREKPALVLGLRDFSLAESQSDVRWGNSRSRPSLGQEISNSPIFDLICSFSAQAVR
jgi:hypothetical protein